MPQGFDGVEAGGAAGGHEAEEDADGGGEDEGDSRGWRWQMKRSVWMLAALSAVSPLTACGQDRAAAEGWTAQRDWYFWRTSPDA